MSIITNLGKFFIRLRKSTRLLWQGHDKSEDEWLTNTKYLAMDNVAVQGNWLSVALQKLDTNAKIKERYLIILTYPQNKQGITQ